MEETKIEKIINIRLNKTKLKISLTIGIMCFILSFFIIIQINTIKDANQTIGSTYSDSKLKDEILKWKENYEKLYKEVEIQEIILNKQRELATKDNADLEQIEQEIKNLNNVIRTYRCRRYRINYHIE